MKPVAYIHNDFTEKFGIPRQSGLCPEVTAKIVFEPQYRVAEALRGLSDFSHIWLIWDFSLFHSSEWSPTVRPPRLGGNRRMGVFATRSPNRPNPIGLSSVRLLGIEHTDNEGDILIVSGADLADGTPIFDIKPYIAYTDSHPDATGGFTAEHTDYTLEVLIAPELLGRLPENMQAALISVLAQDPRPAYQSDPSRIYGFSYGGYEIKFTVCGRQLTVTEIDG